MTKDNKLVGCWVSVEYSFCSYNFLDGGMGFYSFGPGKKEFVYTDNSDSVTVHYNGDLAASTFKYTIDEDFLFIQDSFGNLVKYKKQGEKI